MAFVWMAMVGCCTAQQDKLRVVEHRALLALATGAAGEHWVHPWTAAVLATDPCQDEWPGVWCTNDGYVRRMYESLGRCAVGALSITSHCSVAGRCMGWAYRHLHGEHLAGTIPGALGNLKRIEELDLGNNFLTGSIPESLGRLSTLQHLDLSSNNLQGWFGMMDVAL